MVGLPEHGTPPLYDDGWRDHDRFWRARARNRHAYEARRVFPKREIRHSHTDGERATDTRVGVLPLLAKPAEIRLAVRNAHHAGPRRSKDHTAAERGGGDGGSGETIIISRSCVRVRARALVCFGFYFFRVGCFSRTLYYILHSKLDSWRAKRYQNGKQRKISARRDFEWGGWEYTKNEKVLPFTVQTRPVFVSFTRSPSGFQTI